MRVVARHFLVMRKGVAMMAPMMLARKRLVMASKGWARTMAMGSATSQSPSPTILPEVLAGVMERTK